MTVHAVVVISSGMIANTRVFYGRRNFTMSEGERAELRVLSLSVAPLTEAKQKRMDALLHRARTETTVEFSETLASARIPIPGGKHLTDHAGRRKHEGLADDIPSRVELVRRVFGLSTGGRPWMDAVMTDLLLRLHGERGRIPELP